MYELNSLAPTGSTGNVTGATLHVEGGTGETIVFQFVVEAAGATPTVTYKYQGSADGVNWYDIAYTTDATDTAAVATRSMTALGAQIAFLSNPLARKYSNYRVVTSANTNVTFRAELYRVT